MNEEIVANARLIVMKIINVNLNHGEKKTILKKEPSLLKFQPAEIIHLNNSSSDSNDC